MTRHWGLVVCVACCLSALPGRSGAQVVLQCPGGDADAVNARDTDGRTCRHLTGGDGFITMADGKLQYMFGFSDVTGLPEGQVMGEGMLAAQFPAPTITLDQGTKFYLTLTNVGMVMRPDLFDPHSVHFHGFPQASAIFDGVPESTVGVNMGASFTYFYNVVEPGTYMYHCHVEATEHIQMGMIGNLYVRPVQNGTAIGGFTTFAYNDGDGSTGYDVEYPVQIGAFDPAFHDASMSVQPLPFALIEDRYPMLNGRGYPDTVNPLALTPPVQNGGKPSQVVSSRITASAGQRILLRVSNLSVANFYTLATLGVPMRVVGKDAKLLRGPIVAGVSQDLTYNTNSVTLGGGESMDVILDTTGLSVGTYLLYTTNLNYLSNDGEDFGGLLTEIVIQ